MNLTTHHDLSSLSFYESSVEGTVHIYYLEQGLEVILCNPRIKRSPKADTKATQL